MVDRVLLVLLVAGVWAVALRPVSPGAHSGQQCEVEGTGYGEIESSGEVYVHTFNGVAYCR